MQKLLACLLFALGGLSAAENGCAGQGCKAADLPEDEVSALVQVRRLNATKSSDHDLTKISTPNVPNVTSFMADGPSCSILGHNPCLIFNFTTKDPFTCFENTWENGDVGQAIFVCDSKGLHIGVTSGDDLKCETVDISKGPRIAPADVDKFFAGEWVSGNTDMYGLTPKPSIVMPASCKSALLQTSL
mmetsp:Transcript_12233/g.32319  ORF Transcript_12233/g.32319 Transcript_12233/m.32319 type:complete len:188 (+) Transcript_12233:78-641(+)